MRITSSADFFFIFGCGSTGAEGQNLLELGANYVHLLDLDKHIMNPINKNLQKYKK